MGYNPVTVEFKNPRDSPTNADWFRATAQMNKRTNTFSPPEIDMVKVENEWKPVFTYKYCSNESCGATFRNLGRFNANWPTKSCKCLESKNKQKGWCILGSCDGTGRVAKFEWGIAMTCPICKTKKYGSGTLKHFSIDDATESLKNHPTLRNDVKYYHDYRKRGITLRPDETTIFMYYNPDQ